MQVCSYSAENQPHISWLDDNPNNLRLHPRIIRGGAEVSMNVLRQTDTVVKSWGNVRIAMQNYKSVCSGDDLCCPETHTHRQLLISCTISWGGWAKNCYDRKCFEISQAQNSRHEVSVLTMLKTELTGWQWHRLQQSRLCGDYYERG